MKRAGNVFEECISFRPLEQDFAEGRINENRLVQSAGSLIAHIAHANTMALRGTWFAAS